jgi:hypothetical protein
VKRAQDCLIYFFCIAGILFSLNLFRLDLFRTLTRQAEPIGTITFKYRAAQRRFTDRVLWSRLRQESPVYNGDLIRTAKLSEAEITFTRGAVITLAENSLIRVSQDRVDINEGEISAGVGDFALLLVSGDRQVMVETGAVVSAGVDGQDFTLRVMEGSASFVIPGESGITPAGETVILGENSERLARDATALFPYPQARFLSPEPGEVGVPFRWNRINMDPEEMARLEIAEDRSFTRIVFSEELAGDTAVVDLKPGAYFWRVSLADAEGSDHAPNTLSFRILFAPAPVLITPAEGYRYQFRLKRPFVRFQWTETAEASLYRLEAADNPEMANPVLSKEVRGNSFYSSDLGPGVWYWRVRPVFSAAYSGVAGEKDPASFSIVQSGALKTPELQNPHDRSTVNVAADQRDVYFSWLPEMEARSYRILISADRNLANPIVDEIVRDNFYVYHVGQKRISPGQYYWAVSQIDVEGNNSSPSPARSFAAMEGELIQRLVFPPDGYIAAAAMLPDMRFTWKTNLPFQTWLQISDRADFSSVVIDEAINGEAFQGRMLSEGMWYWRIQAKGTGGMAFETQSRAFTVVPALPAPALLNPISNRRVVIRENEPAAFSWGASEGAEYYQFRLYHRENRNDPIYDNLVERTIQSLSMDSYPDGSYYWTVQGFAQESSRNTRRTGLLSEDAFIIRKLYPVSLDYPGNGETFEGLQAYLEPGTARWSSVDSLSASQFILSRNRDFSGPPVAVINNPPATILLPRLREGDYYWTIRAETSDGFDVSAKSPRLFRTLPIPPLPEAANRLPADGKIIGGAELKENRRIAFSWDVVPDASGYVFTLENEDTGQTIARKEPMEETSFALEDMSILDVGAFVWRVEAVLAGPGERWGDTDVIIQRGEIGENRFRIEFDLPVAPVLRTPGLLYGRE